MQRRQVPTEFRDGRLEPSLVPEIAGVRVEIHTPTRFREPYHHHASIEINYLDGVDMTYAFAERTVRVPQKTLTVFWGGAPHRVVDVTGTGKIMNLYLSLGSFLRCAPSPALVEALFGGGILAATQASERDGDWLRQLLEETGQTNPEWKAQHFLETRARLTRFSLEGWNPLLQPRRPGTGTGRALADMRKVEAMLRFISETFASPIGNADIAAAAHLSEHHAARLFSRIMGQTMKTHVSNVRIGHAMMLLRETDLKIAAIAHDSGFQSLSSFYETFTTIRGVSPAAFRSHG